MVVIVSLLLQVNLLAQVPPITIHVETAGTLPSLIAANRKFEITDLTLTGNLNGTDIRYIREMAGRSYEGSVGNSYGRATNGKLANLDLSGTNIVSGGDYYLNYYSGGSLYTKCYTTDNQISQNMFYGCIMLEAIILPNSVTSIGSYAFSTCGRLTSISIPEGVASIGSYAFYITSLRSIIIPESVTSIEQGAFRYCRILTSVTIPNSITSIEERTFDGCTGLTSVTIPNSVISIGYEAFHNCTGLTSITIPNSVTSIGENAFSSCTGLTSIIIPDSVTSIKSSAFRDCTGLTNVIIGNSVTSIGSYAFYRCTRLTSITIGNSVTSIESDAFSGCTGFASIIIGDNLTSFSAFSFYNYTELTGITVSEQNQNYSSMDGVLFNKDKTTIICFPIANRLYYTIPNSVTSIGENAFRGCLGLKRVTIPERVTSIGSFAFYNCIKLTEIHSKNPIPPSLGLNCFQNVNKTTFKLYVPIGSKSAYWLAWGFDNVIEEEIEQYSLSVSYNEGGKVLVNDKDILNSEIEAGQSVTFTIVPDEGYEIDKVVFNEQDITSQVSDNTFVTQINYSSVFEVSFKKIDDVAINVINKNNIIVQSLSNGIAIETKEQTPISVYNLSGQKVYQSIIIGNVEVALNKGIYILRVNDESQKVIVK